MKPTLLQLAEIFHSDKLHWHSYIPKYEELFKDRKVETLLEIGIGYADLMTPFLPEGVSYIHGSSLYMWQEYFPDAAIFACDIREGTLINEGRIHSMVCDQSSRSDLFKVAYECKRFPDVIIDDGSHIYEHQRITAQFFVPYMPVGALYVIEDVWDNEKGHALATEFGGELWRGEKGRDDNMVVIQK
jgi:hypothetical protein